MAPAGPRGEAAVLSPARRWAGPGLLAIVLLVWSVAWLAGARRPEPDLLPFLKRAFPMASYERVAGGGYLVERRGEVIGHGAAATAAGYGGPITVAVATTPAGTLHALAILEYRDTPAMRRSQQPLLASLVGRDARAPLEIGHDLDAVSGASFSSRAIAEATRAAAARVADRAAAGPGAAPFGSPEAVLLLLFGGALAGRHGRRLTSRGRRRLRWALLLASLAAIGLLWNRPWVIAFPIRLAAGDWPSWHGHLYWYLLLGALLLGFDRSGRGPWCPWLCPFGAAQELAGLVGRAHRRRVPAPGLFRWVKRLLLVAAVALGLFHRSPGAASFEIFGTLFRGAGSGFQVAILLFTGVSALFVLRPFCHWLCPVDVLERALARLRRVGLRALGRVQPSRAPATVRLRVLPVRRSPRDPLRVGRDRLLTAVGLFCAGLVVAHLASSYDQLSAGNQLGLLSETFVAAAPPR